MAIRIGLIHPGNMGAAVGGQLVRAGHVVAWASTGRSPATRRRAEAAGLTDAGTIKRLCGTADVVISICPPAIALPVARSVAGFSGPYVDANAVSPALAREIAATVSHGGATPVDGGIVGGPPDGASGPRLYLSGPETASVAGLFAVTTVEVRELGAQIGTASALKMCYAAYTKGRAALLLSAAAAARAEGVEAALRAEWERSGPELAAALSAAVHNGTGKGTRWVAEMREIAATFASHRLPAGFHESAATVFDATGRLPDDADDRAVLEALTAPAGHRRQPM